MRGVREDQKNGWLFISSNADTHASLKPVISHVAVHCYSWSAGNGKTVTVVCGFSVTSYHVTQTAGSGGDLPEARKFGGCYVFGIQSLHAQLEDIYGEKRLPRCLTS